MKRWQHGVVMANLVLNDGREVTFGTGTGVVHLPPIHGEH